MALQKIVHLVSPLACDDRTDGIEKFAPRRHQIGTYIGEARLIGDVATQPRGGQPPAQFGTAPPRPAARAGSVDEDAVRASLPVGEHRAFLPRVEQPRFDARRPCPRGSEERPGGKGGVRTCSTGW